MADGRVTTGIGPVRGHSHGYEAHRDGRTGTRAAHEAEEHPEGHEGEGLISHLGYCG